jgi:flagellar assembly protein FliH
MPGVIRRDTPLQTRVLSLASIEERAAEIMRAAESRAQALAQEGRRASEIAFESERQRGYQQGLEEGRVSGHAEMRNAAVAAAAQLRAEAKQDLDYLINTLTTAIGQIESERRRLLAEAESGLLEVALAVGGRVCSLAIGQSLTPALPLVRELLASLRQRVDVELRINPTERDSLEAAASELLAAAGRSNHVAIIADPDVSRGGARLVSREGTIDATIETQLDRIAAALLGTREPSGSGGATQPTSVFPDSVSSRLGDPESPDA